MSDAHVSLFHCAIGCALVSALIISRDCWWLLGLLWLLVIVIRSGAGWRKIGELLLILFVASGWFWSRNLHYARLNWTTETLRHVQLIVYPDDVQVNGDQLAVLGHNTQGQRIQAYGRLTSNQETKKYSDLHGVTSWQIDGNNQLPDVARNKNQRDARKQAHINGIHGRLSMTAWQSTPEKGSLFTSMTGFPHVIRKALLRHFDHFPRTLREYADNLLVGESDNTFYEHNPGLKQLGLLHLFSISGMHIVYLIGLCRWILGRCHVTVEVCNVALAVLLPIYAVIAGGSATLIRAVLIGELSLLQPLVNVRGFKLSGLSAWSFSLMGGLFLQPSVLFTLGGQLSYLLAFTLLYVGDKKPWWQAWLMNLVGIPLILHALYQVHLLSTPVNLLMIPLFGWLIFPAVMIAAIVGGFLPMIAGVVDHLLAIFTYLTTWLGALPGQITFGKLPVLLTIVSLVLTLLILDADRHAPRYLMCLVGCYILGFALIHVPLDGEVAFFDVGQGDSILLRSPFNKHVSMIDTGGRVGFSKPGWAVGTPASARVIAIQVNYLHSRGITTIDDLNCSHQDADHIGDVGELMKAIHVKRLTVPAGMQQSRGFQTKIKPFLHHTKVIELQVGKQLDDFPFIVHHPFKPGPGGNEDSVSLSAIRNGQHFMFMGDLDQVGERAILQAEPQLQVDVLKLGHHGSDTASAPEFLKQLQPRLAIISAGRQNHYGHPKQTVLNTLANQQIAALNTADVGMISYDYYSWGSGKWHTMLGNQIPRAGSPKRAEN